MVNASLNKAELLEHVSRLDAQVTQLSRELSDSCSEADRFRKLLGGIDARVRALEAGQPAMPLSAARLPRLVRVARKRLRALGLWPQKVSSRRAEADVLMKDSILASVAIPASDDIKPFLEPVIGYDAWLAANTFTSTQEADLRAALSKSETSPLISIVTPIYNTPVRLLREMVASVEAQIYLNWELCLVDDGSSDPATREALDQISAQSSRISVRFLGENRGIAEATNAAVEMAKGEILVFLDHDDLLSPDCLGETALYYARRPDTDLLYSDDDKIDDNGRRFAPQFKPDWSPILLLSFMYMSHVVSVRRSLFEQVGGLRTAFNGSQDYDFALRAGEVARHVGHIPRVLYHWRATEGSTAQSGDAKPGSFDAGLSAVQQALERRGITATASHPAWAQKARIGMFSLEFLDEGPDVTIIIPTYNHASLLRDCLESLELTTYANYEVLVIDNDSDDPDTLTYLRTVAQRKRHRVISIPKPASGFSFAALMNEAVSHATTDFVLFLNNDTRVISPRWLSQMIGYGRMDGVGAVGARLYFGDGTLQHAGIVNGFHEGLAGHAFRGALPHDWGYLSFIKTAREFSAVTAACMLTPRALFLSIGGFDETAFSVAYNDVDYGYRLSIQGWSSVYCPEAELYHFEGKTRGKRDNPKEVANLRNRYRDFVDKYYNPNLSLTNERFEPGSRRQPGHSRETVRVCAVSHNLNHEGAPNTLLDLMVGLKKSQEADVVILAPSDGPLRAAYEEAGIEVVLFNAPDQGADLATFQKAINDLADLYGQLGAQAVVANTLPMFFAVNAATIAGVGAIWCQHESEPWESYFNVETPSVRAYAYAAFGQAYRVTYVANATRLAWAPVQTRQNAQVIRHGVPPERVKAEVGRWSRDDARRHLLVGDGEVVVILMGTVCRRKGQLDVLDALEKGGPGPIARLRVFIVGALAEADYACTITDRIAALPPETSARITVTGGVDDMTVYYAAADIAICTSRIESAPRVIVEAMAFSLPLVTTPVFGIPELVDFDLNALAYQPGDTAMLWAHLELLASDSDLRARMGSKSLDVLASRPDYQDMLVQYAAIIREAAVSSERISVVAT